MTSSSPRGWTDTSCSETLNLVLEGAAGRGQVFDGSGRVTLAFAGLVAERPLSGGCRPASNLQIQPPPSSTADLCPGLATWW